MTDVSYIIDASAWSVAGFLFGVCAGWMVRDLKEKK